MKSGGVTMLVVLVVAVVGRVVVVQGVFLDWLALQRGSSGLSGPIQAVKEGGKGKVG